MDSSEIDSSTSLDVDKPKKKVFRCPFDDCDAKFEKHSKVLHHVRKHTGEKPYVCDENGCTKAYTNSSHLRRHKAMVHSKKEKVLCTHPGCKLEFYNTSNMKRHIARVHDENRKYPYMCDSCNKGFFKKRLLQKHTVEHTGVLGFECTICKMRFAISTDLRRHQRTHTTYTCDCGEKFERWKALLKHKREVHKPDTICDECGRKFADINSLRQHKKKIHVAPENVVIFECPRDGCKNTYMYKKNLKEHIKYFHDKKPKKKIPCPIENCGASLSRMQCLKKHLELHKTGVVKKTRRETRWDAGIPKKKVATELTGLSHDLKIEKTKNKGSKSKNRNSGENKTYTSDAGIQLDEERDTSDSEFTYSSVSLQNKDLTFISDDSISEESYFNDQLDDETYETVNSLPEVDSRTDKESYTQIVPHQQLNLNTNSNSHNRSKSKESRVSLKSRQVDSSDTNPESEEAGSEQECRKNKMLPYSNLKRRALNTTGSDTHLSKNHLLDSDRNTESEEASSERECQDSDVLNLKPIEDSGTSLPQNGECRNVETPSEQECDESNVSQSFNPTMDNVIVIDSDSPIESDSETECNQLHHLNQSNEVLNINYFDTHLSQNGLLDSHTNAESEEAPSLQEWDNSNLIVIDSDESDLETECRNHRVKDVHQGVKRKFVETTSADETRQTHAYKKIFRDRTGVESLGETEENGVYEKVLQFQVAGPEAVDSNVIVIEYDKGMDLRPDNFLKT